MVWLDILGLYWCVYLALFGCISCALSLGAVGFTFIRYLFMSLSIITPHFKLIFEFPLWRYQFSVSVFLSIMTIVFIFVCLAIVMLFCCTIFFICFRLRWCLLCKALCVLFVMNFYLFWLLNTGTCFVSYCPSIL
jgi:hypothetical protein